MRTVKFKINGNYGHFKIPYSNNNPLTYSFITKTALIGLIGAVIGIERKDFKRLFPILSDNLMYSLSINNDFIKESISTYSCNFDNYSKSDDRPNKTPRPMEYIKNPNWTIYITCISEDMETNKLFDNFCYNILNGFYIWKPTLGIKQCDCTITDIEIGDAEKNNGEFITKTFVTDYPTTDEDIIIYNDNIPTHQNEHWYNDPSKNVSVFFADNNKYLKSNGDFYKMNDENFVLI